MLLATVRREVFTSLDDVELGETTETNSSNLRIRNDYCLFCIR